MRNKLFGIPQAPNYKYALAALLTYWVFKCRDRKHSPAMGEKTWTYLQSSIANSAFTATRLETYIANLQKALLTENLRPIELKQILGDDPSNPVVVRLHPETGEMIQSDNEAKLIGTGYRDLIDYALAQEKCKERDILDLLRKEPSVINLFCRARFEEDRVTGLDKMKEDFIDVELEPVGLLES